MGRVVTPVLVFDGVTKTLSDRLVLDDVSFQVHAGSVVALAGRNGSGKSTCIRLLARHTSPDRGLILLAGQPVEKLSTLVGHVSVLGDMVGLPTDIPVRRVLKVMGHLLDLDDARLATAADALQLHDKDDVRVSRLSRGWVQRLRLAVALAGRGPLLVLDEPTNGLDAPGKDWLAEQLRLRRDEGAAVLVVTHEHPELERYADELVVLDRSVRYTGPVLSAHHYAELLEAA